VIEIRTILVPIDLSEASQRALDRATAVAGWYKARVTALHVYARWPLVDVVPSLSAPMESLRLDATARRQLTAAVEAFVARRAQPEVPVEVRFVEAPDVVPEIMAQAAGIDLLVLGSHGRSGVNRLMLGSVTEKVMRAVKCPVLIEPPHDTKPAAASATPERILCPVDFSAASTAALGHALALAEESDAHLTVMHVIEVPPEINEIPTSAAFDVTELRLAAEAHALERLRALIPADARAFCTVETAVVEGKASREVLRRADAERADLIVMGVHGRSAFDLWLFGSNTQVVARAATCPVLVVHG
jgi:nucleotide-binding universal stress UspA family protein